MLIFYYNKFKNNCHVIYNCFNRRIQVAEQEYKASFDDELNLFKERIKKRAKQKLEAALREQEEEEKKARLGPGGLDPIEVFESLPDVSNFY